MDFAYHLPEWARGIHIANTTVALLTLVPAVYYAVAIKHHLIYLTPVLSLALAYENLLLVLPISYQVSQAQETGWVMNALIPPLFLVTCFETGYVIHKERSVRYLGINFDEGKRVDTTPCSWFLRYIVGLVAVVILAITLLVNFARFFSRPSARAGMAGYIALGHPDTAHFYISLVPSYVLSVVSIFIGAQIKRYGAHSTLLIRQSYGWNLMLVGALIQCAGQFPAQMSIYPVTSMLGQTLLLVCVVLTHREVYRDLTEADKISDFLRRQTLAQQRLAQQPKPPPRAHRHHHHNHHQHNHNSMDGGGGHGPQQLLHNNNNHYHQHHKTSSGYGGEVGGMMMAGGGKAAAGGGDPVGGGGGVVDESHVAIEMIPPPPPPAIGKVDSQDSKRSEEGVTMTTAAAASAMVTETTSL